MMNKASQKWLKWFGWVLFFGIWVGVFVPTVASCGDECLYVTARHFFYFNQIVLTTAALALGLLWWKKSVTIGEVIACAGFASLLTWQSIFQQLHPFLSKHNLYPLWFKTSASGEHVVSFQYARVYLMMFLSGGFYWMMLKKDFRSMERVLWAWSFAALCVFSFCMHKVVGRIAFVDYQEEVAARIERGLGAVSPMQPWMCENLALDCRLLGLGETFKGSKPKEKNKLRSHVDTAEIIDRQINKMVMEPLRLNAVGVPLIMSESAFAKDSNVIRAITVGAVRLNEEMVLVAIDYDQTAKALDLYLVYFTMLMVGFVLVWGGGGWFLCRFHAKMRNGKI